MKANVNRRTALICSTFPNTERYRGVISYPSNDCSGHGDDCDDTSYNGWHTNRYRGWHSSLRYHHRVTIHFWRTKTLKW